MAVRWNTLLGEIERLSAFAEDWNEGLAEDFVRNVEAIAARKRAQRESIGKLAEELKAVHAVYIQLLAFFDLERATLAWSAANCPGADVERVLEILGQWRAQLLQYDGKFPPPETELRSYEAMQRFVFEAQTAEAMIRPGFGTLDALLRPVESAAAPAAVAPAAGPVAAAIPAAAALAAEPPAPVAPAASALAAEPPAAVVPATSTPAPEPMASQEAVQEPAVAQ